MKHQNVNQEKVALKSADITSLIHLRGVSKEYGASALPCMALSKVNLDVHHGEFMAITGRSGSGKSTLINIITGIDSPTEGEVHVASSALHAMSQDRLAAWRGKNVGIIFQFFQLLPTLTVAENVMLPMDFCNTYPPSERRSRAMTLLSKLGIADQADKLPADLSGGQQQRTAIARALANDPPILVADEPTGNLDSKTSDEVMQLFSQLADEGKTIVMVTHERNFSHHFTRSITLVDGVVLADAKSAGVRCHV